MTNHIGSDITSLLEPMGFSRNSSSLVLFFILSFSALAVLTVVSHFKSPLRKYPGPFFASMCYPSVVSFLPVDAINIAFNQTANRSSGFTRLWYMYQAWTGNSHLVLEQLHRQYGPIVRITPSIIDVDMPELIKTIFSIKGDWLKVSDKPPSCRNNTII